ncbi:MAG: hypothetical protein ACYCOU_23240 [Sulfobacillus sp.]
MKDNFPILKKVLSCCLLDMLQARKETPVKRKSSVLSGKREQERFEVSVDERAFITISNPRWSSSMGISFKWVPLGYETDTPDFDELEHDIAHGGAVVYLDSGNLRISLEEEQSGTYLMVQKDDEMGRSYAKLCCKVADATQSIRQFIEGFGAAVKQANEDKRPTGGEPVSGEPRKHLLFNHNYNRGTAILQAAQEFYGSDGCWKEVEIGISHLVLGVDQLRGRIRSYSDVEGQPFFDVWLGDVDRSAFEQHCNYPAVTHSPSVEGSYTFKSSDLTKVLDALM